MRKLALKIFLIIALFPSAVLAQDLQEALVAIGDEDYRAAKLIIDSLIQTPPHDQAPEVWYYRGEIYNELANDLRGIYNNPYDTAAIYKAYDSYLKVRQLDIYHPLADSSMKELDTLFNASINTAGNFFQTALEEESKTYNQRPPSFITDLYRKALSAAQLSQKLNPDDTLGYSIAAYSALALGSYGEYIKNTESLLQVLPRSQSRRQHYKSLIAITEKRDLTQTLRILDRALEDFPNDAEFQKKRIIILEEIGSNEMQQLEDALAQAEAEPYNPINYYNLGIIYQRMKSPKEAKANYKKCIQLDPSNFDATYNLAGIIYNQAVSILKEIGKLNFTDYQRKGPPMEEEANKIFKKALPYFEKLYGLDPTNQRVLIPLYHIYKRLDDESRAEAIKSELLAVKPEYFDQ